MTISYDWLCQYLPLENLAVKDAVEPGKLSVILTSIGLEVESLEKKENIRGGLANLVVGEVLNCEKHPGADKLKITRVNIGGDQILQIVCGAPNVGVGQKVIVAPVGTTVHPISGEDFLIKKAKIRGVESMGMICAEDEIGLGNDHAGIKILDAELHPGTKLTEIFNIQTDYVFEIGLTPNRTDAMSHLGVARDVCAYLSYHLDQEIRPDNPLAKYSSTNGNAETNFVKIEDEKACARFCGAKISGIEVKESPEWLKERLSIIGINSINNIVDITNFVLHESGQPLHAYDADKVLNESLFIRSARKGESFVTLDSKERKMNEGDILVADAEKPLCIAGVYGGINSGVKAETKNIILESAWFNPVNIRRTSLQHNLRTDAAARFEKGVDIGNTYRVLLRAVDLIRETCPGAVVEKITDVFPAPPAARTVELDFDYLKKLSGKAYPSPLVRSVLNNLGFEILNISEEKIKVNVPTSKTDIHAPADLVEEIMRIDGLDNIEIPKGIYITPSIDSTANARSLREKLANHLVGLGFYETFTNSITNSAYYNEEVLATSARMINSLSSELDILRPAMVQSALAVVAHNQNRKNNDLRCFEFGKIYSHADNQFTETRKLCIYITGSSEPGWRIKSHRTDFFQLKGIIENLLHFAGTPAMSFQDVNLSGYINSTGIQVKKQEMGFVGEVSQKLLKIFDIKQPVFYAELDWDALLSLVSKQRVTFREIPKYPAVTRDLSLVVDKGVSYGALRDTVKQVNIPELKKLALFDLFESEKLGENKKAMAISFTLQDETKTLTDEDTETMMNTLITAFETKNGAVIRK
jgi:phenylalanyl-tRNA synthetase beta chain